MKKQITRALHASGRRRRSWSNIQHAHCVNANVTHQKMTLQSNEMAKRFLAGHAIVECKTADCLRLLQSPRTGRDAPMRIVDTTTDPRHALEYLTLLSWPASRHVVFSASDKCTAMVNNSRNGSDYADQRSWLPCHLNSRFVRIVNEPGFTWTNGIERETLRFAATIFELFDPDGECVRSVACMDDGGKWVFNEFGLQHTIEESFPYNARRKRDRFTSQQLETLIVAYGLPVVDSDVFLAAGHYCLFETMSEPKNTCTLVEADDPAYGYYRRGLTWVPNMKTHASSVVADFERCLRLNPEYEPRVRAALDAAHRVLANQ